MVGIRKVSAAALAVAMGLVGVGQASSQVVEIGKLGSITVPTSVTVLGTTPATGDNVTYTSGGITITGNASISGELNGSSSVTTKVKTPGTTYAITETGLTISPGPILLSVDGSALPLPGGASILESLYADPLDRAFGGVKSGVTNDTVFIGSVLFDHSNCYSTGSGVSKVSHCSDQSFGGLLDLYPSNAPGGDFSITELFQIVNPNITPISGQMTTYLYPNGGQMVPEASTWAMLGLGFAGIGFVGFQRRRETRYSL